MPQKEQDYRCTKESQITQNEIDIVELKARADFKDMRIDELKDGMKKLNEKLDKINESLNDLTRKSEKDDFDIDSRVTKLENTQMVLKWVSGIILTIVGTLLATITFALTHFH